MKKFLLVSVLLAMVMVIPSMVMASIVVYQGSFSFDRGGEFHAVGPSNGYYISGKTSNITYDGSFQTFCLEKSETFNPGTSYNFDITQNAIGGGGGASGGADPISQGTAWLYSQFATGTLTLGNYFGTNRKINAGLLQDAIWSLEGEIIAPTGNTYYDSAIAITGYSNNYTGNDVWVLNLTDGAALHQDMLYFGNKTCSSVPIPPTAYLLGAGLLGLIGMRRKFRK